MDPLTRQIAAVEGLAAEKADHELARALTRKQDRELARELETEEVSSETEPTYDRTATREVDQTELIIQDLRKNGYSVVGSVLSRAECDRAVDGLWEWLASLSSGIERSDPGTWGSDRWPLSSGHGLIQHHAVGHAPFAWDVRMNSNVRKVFGDLWGTGDLITSFNGVCVMRPPELTKCIFRTSLDKSWFHTDQSKKTVGKVPTRNGFQCIQGAVNLEASGEGDGCFRVLSGSHLFHASAPWVGSGKDWYKLLDKDITWYKGQGCVDTLITCPKGGMVLWDSRAIHANVKPARDRQFPRFRYTTFVCMTPRSHLTSSGAKRRREAFENNRCTSHWPNRMRLNGKGPQLRGKQDACSAPVVVRKQEWESLV